MIDGELESEADYQLHYLAKGDYLAEREKLHKIFATRPTSRVTTQAHRTETHLEQFYRKCGGHPLGKSLKGFEDRREQNQLRYRSAVSPSSIEGLETLHEGTRRQAGHCETRPARTP